MKKNKSEKQAKEAPVSFRPFEKILKPILKQENASTATRPSDTPKAKKIKPHNESSTAHSTSAENAAIQDSTRDDLFLFRRRMLGVVPLTEGNRVVDAEIQPSRFRTMLSAPIALSDEDQKARAQLFELVEGNAKFEVHDDGKRLEGKRVGLDATTWRTLKRGQFFIDARFDLHGKTTEEARLALEDFLKQCRARQDRCVLIIHGQGHHSPARMGVLRGEISAWLSQGFASMHVAAFVSALPEDGGEGALYILLRKNTYGD